MPEMNIICYEYHRHLYTIRILYTNEIMFSGLCLRRRDPAITFHVVRFESGSRYHVPIISMTRAQSDHEI